MPSPFYCVVLALFIVSTTLVLTSDPRQHVYTCTFCSIPKHGTRQNQPKPPESPATTNKTSQNDPKPSTLYLNTTGLRVIFA